MLERLEDSPGGMDIVGTPDTQVWRGWHAGLGVPVREATDGAVLQRAASSSCFSTASRAGEALVTTTDEGSHVDHCWDIMAPFHQGVMSLGRGSL